MTARPLVIMGIGELGQLAHYYFEQDTGRRVVGFTVDAEYANASQFRGLPLVPFDQVESTFPPSQHDLFIAIGYSGLNVARATKCSAARALGYRLASYVSTRASVWPDLELGENCFVMEGSIIQPFTRIGDNVIIWSGCLISHHVAIGDNCFIASGVTVSGGVIIEPNCFVGVNATIREHLTIGRDCIIGAGGLILRNALAGSSYLAIPTEKSSIPSNRLKSML